MPEKDIVALHVEKEFKQFIVVFILLDIQNKGCVTFKIHCTV